MSRVKFPTIFFSIFKEINLSFGICVIYAKTIINLNVIVSEFIYLTASWLSSYPPPLG